MEKTKNFLMYLMVGIVKAYSALKTPILNFIVGILGFIGVALVVATPICIVAGISMFMADYFSLDSRLILLCWVSLPMFVVLLMAIYQAGERLVDDLKTWRSNG